MSRSSHLRLVPFSADDLSVAEVLVRSSQEVVSDPTLMAAAMSLYFQWSEISSCVLVRSERDSIPIEVVMDYDREDRNPSEIFIRIKSQAENIFFEVDQAITIRFELFRQCFEFQSKVIAVPEVGATESTWNLISEIPDILVTYRQRRLPRVFVNAENLDVLPPCSLISADNSELISEVKVVEMGMSSIRIECSSIDGHSAHFIKFGCIQIPINCIRQNGTEAIFALKAKTSSEVGSVFDLYRKLAFPDLRPRREFSSGTIADLYGKTGYFDKFSTEQERGDRVAEIELTWERLLAVSHERTADYVVVDENENPSGASSASHCFNHDNSEVWAFHQLCAVATPNLLEHSGQLYTWRAEYLASRLENVKVVGWFDSRSRWLERIYVKFAFQKYRLDCLFPVSVSKKIFTRSIPQSDVRTSSWSSLETIRNIASTRKCFGGIGPAFLNASGILDAIVMTDNSAESVMQLTQIGSALVAKSGAEEAKVEVTRLSGVEGNTCDEDFDYGEKVTDVDRMFLFEKAGLVDFVASVEHSVAVTLRKKARGIVESD